MNRQRVIALFVIALGGVLLAVGAYAQGNAVGGADSGAPHGSPALIRTDDNNVELHVMSADPKFGGKECVLRVPVHAENGMSKMKQVELQPLLDKCHRGELPPGVPVQVPRVVP